MNISSNVLKNENATVVLEIGVAKEEVQNKLNDIAQNYQRNAVIPGFRKGKAPLPIVKNKYIVSIKKDTLEDLINTSYLQALKDNNITPYSLPKIDIIEFGEDKDFKFKAEVELFPEVKLGKYKNQEFTKMAYKISGKDIEKELAKVQENMADFVLKENKKSVENDVVTADVVAYDEEGNKLDKYSAENHKFELNKKAIYEEFYKGLLGKKAGDKVEIVKEYRKDYHDKELAGKKIKFEITIKEIREKKLPELNDDFAKDVGDYKNLGELKEAIERQLKDIADRHIETKLEDDILGYIIENSEFKIPESLIQAETERIRKDIESDMQRQGQNLKELIEKNLINEEEFNKNNRENAIRSLKVYLALLEIAKQEKIEATDEDLEEEINNLAKQYQQKPERLKEFLKEEDINNLKATIRNKKTLKFLKENNTIKEGKALKYEDLIKKLSEK